LSESITDPGLSAAVADGDSTDANGTSRSRLEGFFVGDQNVAPASLPVPSGAVELAPDGAWTWFNDERAIVHQGSLFSGYVKSNGTYGITRRDLTTSVNSHLIVSTAAFYQRTSLVPLPTTASDWGPEITRTVPASNTYANTYRLSAEARR